MRVYSEREGTGIIVKILGGPWAEPQRKFLHQIRIENTDFVILGSTLQWPDNLVTFQKIRYVGGGNLSSDWVNDDKVETFWKTPKIKFSFFAFFQFNYIRKTLKISAPKPFFIFFRIFGCHRVPTSGKVMLFFLLTRQLLMAPSITTPLPPQ